MSAATFREDPGKLASGLMAVAVHLAFFFLLVVGVSWQRKPPEAVMVELWNSLPPVPVVKPPEPAPKLEVKPPPPPPPQIKPEPKVIAKPAPEPKPIAKPDIALEKEKQEKVRREREEREKAEQKTREVLAEARKREEADKAEKAKLAKLQAEREAAERARQKAQQDAMERLEAQRAAEQRAAHDKYVGDIRNKIRRYVVLPPDIKGNPQVEFDVVLLPTGDVLGVKMKKSSQHAAYDAAVERAILLAQPLPVPKDPNVFKDFRELNLQFRPNE